MKSKQVKRVEALQRMSANIHRLQDEKVRLEGNLAKAMHNSKLEQLKSSIPRNSIAATFFAVDPEPVICSHIALVDHHIKRAVNEAAKLKHIIEHENN